MSEHTYLDSYQVKEVLKYILREMKDAVDREFIMDIVMMNYRTSLEYTNALIDVCYGLQKELISSQRGSIGNSGW